MKERAELNQEEIEQKISNGEKYVIRQKMPKEGTTIVHDLVYGDVVIENKIFIP